MKRPALALLLGLLLAHGAAGDQLARCRGGRRAAPARAGTPLNAAALQLVPRLPTWLHPASRNCLDCPVTLWPACPPPPAPRLAGRRLAGDTAADASTTLPGSAVNGSLSSNLQDADGSVEMKIINGDDAVAGQFDFMVALFMNVSVSVVHLGAGCAAAHRGCAELHAA